MVGLEWVLFLITRHTLHSTSPNLEQIPIVRTHISFFRLFKLSQSEIRTGLIPVPVLHQHTGRVDTASCRAQTRETNADAITIMVVMRWQCIFGQESVRGDDSTNVAKADLPGSSDRSAMVTAEIEVEPADYHRKGRISAHRDEKQRSVFEMRPRMHSQ